MDFKSWCEDFFFLFCIWILTADLKRKTNDDGQEKLESLNSIFERSIIQARQSFYRSFYNILTNNRFFKDSKSLTNSQTNATKVFVVPDVEIDFST